MARAVSTVLDVAVCLLLVGAAVATLAGAPHHSDRPDGTPGEAAASTVATVTTTVPAADGRRAHGTLAGHLATAAVVDARLDGDRVIESAYPAAVADETVALTSDRTYVTARWEPYPGAPLGGAVQAGPDPPPGADVAARTMSVDAGVETPSEANSFERLALAIAEAYVDRLFPPDRAYASLADSRTADGTSRRYRAAATAVGVDVRQSVADRKVGTANADLAAALATRLEEDLRDRYATPGAASNATSGEVEIAVRRWEP